MLATNTSSLSVAEMAADLVHPERLVGFHFFNPVAVMPLLEVVRTPSTDDETVATALSLARITKKNAVLVKDATGFVVNRMLLRMLAEIFAAVDEGTPIPVADAAMRPLGLPMAPYVLLQLVGPAVALHVAESLHANFGDRFPVSPGLQAIVAAKSQASTTGPRRQAVRIGGDAGADQLAIGPVPRPGPGPHHAWAGRGDRPDVG